MPDDQDTSTTRQSEGDERNPEGIVHNLSSPFRFLQLAADELLDVVYEIRMKAAQAISTATDYHWNAASDRLWSQLQQTRDYYRAIEREVAISGRAVQTVLQLAQATNRTMDFKVSYSGPWPTGDDKPMGFDEIEAGLAPISPDRRAELRTEIDSQVRLAATKITPRLRSTSEGDVRDFVLDLIAVEAERPLLDNEVKVLNDWLEYETDEIPTVRWEKRQIRQMLARLELLNLRPSRKGKSSTTQRGTKKKKTRKLDVAKAVKTQHPDWSQAQVAEHIKCSPSLLSDEEYQDWARTVERAAKKSTLKRGAYNVRTGQTEAVHWDESPDMD